MWHRGMKWANAVGKMTPIDLLGAGLPKAFNWWKTIRASLVVQWLGIPVVKPANVGDMSLILSRKIPHTSGQISPRATTSEPTTREATTMRNLHAVSWESPCTPGRPSTAKTRTNPPILLLCIIASVLSSMLFTFSSVCLYLRPDGEHHKMWFSPLFGSKKKKTMFVDYSFASLISLFFWHAWNLQHCLWNSHHRRATSIQWFCNQYYLLP